MAVVSISRIQMRRGQKNTGSGLPQLASGELGWAIDTRELYIGNGAVSEGAPAVGNTKVLTEYDNLFSIANTYTYQTDQGALVTGQDSSSPVERSLQDRLDDRVSVRSFGVIGDGVTDDTVALQRAIDQLYLNPASKGTARSRVVLHIEAGEYLISDTLYIPAFATIKGAGSNQTIIKQTNSSREIVRAVNDSSTPGSPASDASSTFINQARNIHLSGLTFEHTAAQKGLILQSCRDSEFIDIEVNGVWTTSSSITFSSTAVEINSLSDAVSSDSNIFHNCVIKNYAYGIRSNWDIKYNTFRSCIFETQYNSVLLGDDIAQEGAPGQETGPVRNSFTESLFSNINRAAIKIDTGRFNTTMNNSFSSVGNDGGSEKSPASPVVEFNDDSNVSKFDWFSRTDALISGAGLTNVPYIPEISGSAFYSIDYEKSLTFGDFNNTRLFRLPAAESQTYNLEYSITNPDFAKRGTLTVVVNPAINEVEISDDFHFVGDTFYLDKQSFDTSLRTLGTGSDPDTIDVKVSADLNNGSESEIKFTITAKRN